MSTIQTVQPAQSEGIVGKTLRSILSSFNPTPGYLLSPMADILMAGGLSIALFVLMFFFISPSESAFAWGWAAYYLSFVINYPHFAASYQLLYSDAGSDFFSWNNNPGFAAKLWWAGLVVPMVLIGYFLFSLFQESGLLMGYMVNAMFFFVGWHYVRQIFGCVIVLSAARKIYYSKLERWGFLIPLYTLWGISYAGANLYASEGSFFGIPFTSFSLPENTLSILYGILIVSSIYLAGLMLFKFKREKVVTPLAAMLAMASIYLWFLPSVSHPYYLLIIPFLHSLQYLLFVGAYKRNQSVSQISPEKKTSSISRLNILISAFLLLIPFAVAAIVMKQQLVNSFENLLISLYGTIEIVSSSQWIMTAVLVAAGIGLLCWSARMGKTNPAWKITFFMLQIVVVGALLFSIVPTFLDILALGNLLPSAFIYSTAIFGTSLYLFFFTIFVNIHHYFVDNVIWRRDNPHVKAHLFGHPDVK